MRQDALDIARKVEQIKKNHPWTATAADAISTITTAVTSSRNVNTRLIARSTLMAETLLHTLESVIEAHARGQRPEIWGTDYNKISAYAEKVVTDLRTADAGAALPPSTHLAALEAHYGEVDVDTHVPLPVISPYQDEIREALNFKDELINDLCARGLSCVNPDTLGVANKTLNYPHALQASRGYSRGGQVMSASGRPMTMFYGLITGGDAERIGITPQMMSQLTMTEVKPGEMMPLKAGQTYIFNTYAQHKSSENNLMHPTNKDASATLIHCEADGMVRGQASFCAWDERVLGPHDHGGFMGMKWAKRTSDGSLRVRKNITLEARTAVSEKLLPTFLISEIEKSTPVYDVSVPISGEGPNTLIRYESTDMDGNAAISTLVFNGLMPADLKADVINGQIDMRLLAWPCGLALQGLSADQDTRHTLISVERTDRQATTPQPLGEVCRSLARFAAARIILKAAAPKFTSSPLTSQIQITPRRPYDAAQMFVLTGKQSYTIKVSGPTTDGDEIAISAALLARSPDGHVRVFGAPNAQGALPTPAAALRALLPGFSSDDFWIAHGNSALTPTILKALDQLPHNPDGDVIVEACDEDVQQDWTPTFD